MDDRYERWLPAELRAEIDRQHALIKRLMREIGEAAAFLDEQAKRMWVRGEQKSAEECGAMAKKLRGET